eukprot:6674547-Alexandrium_andersonii.AAC.1
MESGPGLGQCAGAVSAQTAKNERPAAQSMGKRAPAWVWSRRRAPLPQREGQAAQEDWACHTVLLWAVCSAATSVGGRGARMAETIRRAAATGPIDDCPMVKARAGS